MEKLELKHLAPYLPYGLNVLHTEKNKMLIISGVYFKGNTDKHFIYKLLNWNLEVISNEAKPILRPLSDFQKETDLELDNHIIICGERFYDVFKNDFRTMGYEKFCWFLEQHYDVFGLIEKGLAIDINTIK